MARIDAHRWREQLRRVGGFSVGDWLIATEAIATLAAVSVAVRCVAPLRMHAWAHEVRQISGNVPPPDAVRRIAWLTDVTGRRVLGVTCLTRALAVARLLARRGVATEVRIGVRKVEGQLAAHAWVEREGRPLNETARHLRQFAPFDTASGRIGEMHWS